MRVDPTGSTDVTLGAGLWEDKSLKLRAVPFKDKVGDLLVQMAVETRNSFNAIDRDVEPFNPSEKLATEDKLSLPNTVEASAIAHQCYVAEGLDDLEDMNKRLRDMKFYFARIVNPRGEKIVCVKSAGVFKRIGTRNPLVALVDDRLEAYESPIFQLDHEFDFVIEEDFIYILKPKQFVVACQMQEAIQAAGPRNAAEIQRFLPTYNLGSIVRNAQTHRVSNLLASIVSLNIFEDFNPEKFHQRCIQLGIEFQPSDEGLVPNDEHTVRFLEVLDCRRYSTDFSNGEPAEWLASGRNRAKR